MDNDTFGRLVVSISVVALLVIVANTLWTKPESRHTLGLGIGLALALVIFFCVGVAISSARSGHMK